MSIRRYPFHPILSTYSTLSKVFHPSEMAFLIRDPIWLCLVHPSLWPLSQVGASLTTIFPPITTFYELVGNTLRWVSESLIPYEIAIGPFESGRQSGQKISPITTFYELLFVDFLNPSTIVFGPFESGRQSGQKISPDNYILLFFDFLNPVR